jgi:hypothetical protein
MNNQQSTSISLSAHRASIRTFQPVIHPSFEVSPEICLSPGTVSAARALVPLRPRHDRPRHRATEARNKFAPSHLQSSRFKIGVEN